MVITACGGIPPDPRFLHTVKNFYSLQSQRIQVQKMKKNEENRTEFHTGRLTPAEAAEIADHAEACGLSTLLRRRVLGLALPAGHQPWCLARTVESGQQLQPDQQARR